ncbi:hypothetical protein B0H34DRAFT_674069 [Crassisporium funariophilum]|nr:hypothetical protein B0H34DRAFT_674069 [Crassisporium funariophilum]
MATLQLIWDATHIYELWSFDNEALHQTAHVMRRLGHSIYLARIGPVAEEPTETVIIKLARGEEEQRAITREFDLYSQDLFHLQGDVVPQCHGIFRGKVDGHPLGCLVLQYCSGPMIMADNREFNRLIMIAACKLHQAGVVHGDLLDAHHILQMGFTPRFIDFSTATRHLCQNGIPTNPYECLSRSVRCCNELIEMEKSYGMMSDAPTMRHAVDATSRFWRQ